MLIKWIFQFFHIFTCWKFQLKDDLPRVWLLLYDLYLRTFSKRKPELLALKDKLFKESEMLCELMKMRKFNIHPIINWEIKDETWNLNNFLLPLTLTFHRHPAPRRQFNFLSNETNTNFFSTLCFTLINIIISFPDIETCLDKMKTKLAASITKIRIEKQALNLQFLLPVHLRDEKVARAVTNPIVTGWINKYKGMWVWISLFFRDVRFQWLNQIFFLLHHHHT